MAPSLAVILVLILTRYTKLCLFLVTIPLNRNNPKEDLERSAEHLMLLVRLAHSLAYMRTLYRLFNRLVLKRKL